MNWQEAFKSNYLGQGDLERPVLAIIKEVVIEKIKGDDGDEDKAVCYFTNGTKPLIVNHTNRMVIEGAFGPRVEDCIGKQIEIYREPNVMLGTKRVGGVRVRIPASAAQPPPNPIYFAPPPAAGNVQLEKSAAWTGFKIKYRDGTAEEKAALFTAAVHKYFKGKPAELITAPEWNQFARDGFELRTPNPISNEAMDLTDCPF